MPRRDKTGPFGKGPLTGRGMGKCSIKDIVGKIDDSVGGGCRGRGRN